MTLLLALALVLAWPSYPDGYRRLTRRAAPGDTCWALNAATCRWQLAAIARDTTVRFIPGSESRRDGRCTRRKLRQAVRP